MRFEERPLHLELSSRITRKRHNSTTGILIYCKNRYIEPSSDCVILPASTTPRICECYIEKNSGINKYGRTCQKLTQAHVPQKKDRADGKHDGRGVGKLL